GIEYYFSKEELNPFLIYCNGKIAGFVLLNSGKYVPKDIEYSIHEIFILKSFRGKGVATNAIKKLFDMYKGKYKVKQLQDNKLAVNFWSKFYKNEDIDYEEEVEVIDGFNGCSQVFEVL
ncbi:MAG: GNAT family N-acetyltransferase, partial [Clostridium sp.]